MNRGVLILDGTSRAIVAISRSLRRRGIRTICAGLGRKGLGLHSRSIFADVALGTDEGSFYDGLTDLLLQFDIDMILPCSDNALALLLPHYASLRQRVYLSFPDPETVTRVLKKHETLEIAVRCGVPTPATYVGGRDFDVSLLKSLRYPLIAKPSEAGPGQPFKVKYFDGFGEIEEFVRGAEFPGEVIFQEFVPGEGVGVSTIVADGRPLVLFQHKRLHEYPPAGGVGVLLESQSVEPKLARASTEILETLRWNGPAMVEFRCNRQTGDYAFMEVNGRFWGSLPLATLTGLDFPYWQWQIAHSVTPEVPASYAQGVRVRWTAGEIQRLADLLVSPQTRQRTETTLFSACAEFVRSFEPRTKSALFSIRDPQPEIRDTTYTFVRVLGSLAWRLSQRVLPPRVAVPLAQVRLLEPQYRRTYLIRCLKRVARRPSRNARDWKGIRRVTFVCRANRIRSPLAAVMLKSELKDGFAPAFEIRSAGTQATADTSYDRRVREAASQMGLSLAGVPQPITSELVSHSDLVVVMDRIVEAELLARFPSAAGKVFLPGEVAANGNACRREILDPDKSAQPEFERFVAELTASVRRMAQLIT